MLRDQATLFTCGVMRTPSFGANCTECKPYVGYGAVKKIENKQVHTAHKATCVLLHYYLFVIDMVLREWDKSTIIPYLFVQVLVIFGGWLQVWSVCG